MTPFKNSEYYFTDSKSNIYFKSYKTGKFEVLKGADINSFVLLTNFYSRDAQNFFKDSTLIKSNYKNYTDYVLLFVVNDSDYTAMLRQTEEKLNVK